MDSSFFSYHHGECLYTLFKTRFTDKCAAKSRQVSDKALRASTITKQTEASTDGQS